MLIRKARISDRASVKEMCDLINKDDYIPQYWDELLSDGDVFVAVENEKIIGINKVKITLDGDGWLSALRIHPDYRKRGIATALTLRSLQQIKGKAPRARMSISSENEPSLTLAKKLGFAEVASCYLLEWKGDKEIPQAEGKLEILKDAEKVWSIISKDENMLRNNFLVPHLYEWYRLNEASLAELIEQDGVLAWKDQLALIHQVPEGWDFSFEIIYLTKDCEQIVKHLLGKCFNERGKGIEAFIPEDLKIKSTLERYGFVRMEWAPGLRIMEREI